MSEGIRVRLPVSKSLTQWLVRKEVDVVQLGLVLIGLKACSVRGQATGQSRSGMQRRAHRYTQVLKGHSNLFLIRFDSGGHFPAITLLFNGVYIKLRFDRGLLTLQLEKGVSTLTTYS